MQTDEHRDPRRLYPWVGALAGVVLLVAAAWAADFIPGDVNDDGVFDVLDSTVLRRDLAGLKPGITQEVLCGNGVLDGGEECDTGLTCGDLGFSFGELVCDAGCVAQVDTCTNTRFEELGLTILDHQTGLEWEKKTGTVGTFVDCDFDPDSGGTCADLNNVNNKYDWFEANGEWLSRLNGQTDDRTGATQSGFAAHADWRVPKLAELLSIVDLAAPGCGVSAPCIDASFGETGPISWSSSSVALFPEAAWFVSFSNGSVNEFDKPITFFVRAVRGGPGITQQVLCGNGVLDAGEECDSGVICSDLGFAFGVLDCGAGCVAEVDSCTNTRFEDLGLTVFDHQTGLEWEKKTNNLNGAGFCDFNPDSIGTCVDLHHVFNSYDWDEASGGWLSRLNGRTTDFTGAAQSGFAGHRDWRLPLLVELLTIVDQSAPDCDTRTAPCIHPAFGPARSTFHHTATLHLDEPGRVFAVRFSDGASFTLAETSEAPLRAVRGP